MEKKMKTKILLLIANILLFAMPLLATTTDSDTIWTRNLLPGDIRGCAFTLRVCAKNNLFRHLVSVYNYILN